jgi:hypothetical protein
MITDLRSIDHLPFFQLKVCSSETLAHCIDRNRCLYDGNQSGDSIGSIVFASQCVQWPANIDPYEREQDSSCEA